MDDESFSNRKSWLSGPRFFIGLGLTIVVIGGLLNGRPASDTAQEVAAEIEQDPDIRESMSALRTHYPSDYQEMLDRLAAAGRARGQEAAGREAFFFMRGFMTAKADAIASAPDAHLDRVADTYLALVRLLRDQDVRLCAQFVTSGFTPGTPPPRAAMTLLNRAAAQQILAAHAGETGGRRPRGPLSPPDMTAWFERIEALDPSAAALIENGSLDRATPAQQCGAGIALHQAVTDLPPAAAANVMANLIRDLLQSPG